MSDKLTAKELAQILFSQDKEIAEENGEENGYEKDGLKAYDGWLLSSSSANDSQTRELLLAVDKVEFAQAWEDLAWAQEYEDDDYEDDADEDDIIQEEKRKKDNEWRDALNGRR